MPAAARLAVLSVLLLSGCGTDDDDALVPGPVGYDLEVGTIREYRVTLRSAVIVEGVPGETELRRDEHTATLTILGPVTHGGVEYLVEQVVNLPAHVGDPRITFERHLREDETGLYGSEWATTDPPVTEERQFLAYPLSMGLQWPLIPEKPILLEAIGQEPVDVTAGRFDTWLIDRGQEFDPGFGNFYHEWYGSPGLVRSIGHLEEELDTEPRSRRISEVIWELVEKRR